MLLAATGVGIAGGGLSFTEIGADQGMSLTADLVESVAWGDYDNDGDEDLYLSINGPNVLFRNDGGGLFRDVTIFTGVGNTLFSVGAAFGDIDNDGDLDLYVVTFGIGSDVLYRNDGPIGPGGENQFTDIAVAAGLTNTASSRGVALVDYNRDGLLDIYVNAIGADILYRNDGNLTFTNVAAALGIDNPGQGVGVVATDLDRDGWVDLFTGNRSSQPNRAYLNHLTALTDVTANGIGQVGLGMGVLSFDYDNDLDFDLYWTAWPGASPVPQRNALYENLDGANYLDVTLASGTEDELGWGISCNAGDVDNDGWEDFYVTNGFDPTTSPNVLFVNDGSGAFTDETLAVGGGAFDGRGVAFADFDDDGDVDLLVTADIGDPVQLWRNDTALGHRWVTFDLEGTCSNRSAIGARIEVRTNLGTLVKEVSGGAGRGSQNSLPVEFGLGTATSISNVRIRWPSGMVQSLGATVMDQRHAVLEPCSSLTLFVEPDALVLTRPHATLPGGFDLVRGDLATLRATGGNFTTSTTDCLADDQDPFFMGFGMDPAPGAGFWFLSREDNGTYDEPSGFQRGARDFEINAAMGACP